MSSFTLIPGGGEDDDDGDDDRCPGRCTDVLRERIDALEACLPQPIHDRRARQIDSREELAQRMSDKLGYYCSLSDLETALNHVRKYAPWHGFTVLHAKRGPTTGEGRFFKVYPRTKALGIMVPARLRKFAMLGLAGTLSHAATMSVNEARAIEFFMTYLGHPKHHNFRLRLEVLVLDKRYMAQKLRLASQEAQRLA